LRWVGILFAFSFCIVFCAGAYLYRVHKDRNLNRPFETAIVTAILEGRGRGSGQFAADIAFQRLGPLLPSECHSVLPLGFSHAGYEIGTAVKIPPILTHTQTLWVLSSRLRTMCWCGRPLTPTA
jgi:hypothetical protein